MNSRLALGLETALVLCLGVWLESAASAQNPNQSWIGVSATATVTAHPDVVDLTGVVTDEGELAGDALTKFRTKKQKALDALQSLAIAGLEVLPQGVSFGTAVPADSRLSVVLRAERGAVPEPPKVAVQETLTVRIKGIDTLSADDLLTTIAKVVDAAQEAGVVFTKPLSEVERISSRGTPLTFTTFKVADPESLRQKAMELAMESARANATRLAALAGVPLGEVMSVQENRIVPYTSPSSQTTPEGTSLTSLEIRQTATIGVNFSIKRD